MKSKRLSLSCFAAVLKKRLLPIVITALALAIAGFTVVALLPHQYAAEAVFYVRDLQADAYFAENGITAAQREVSESLTAEYATIVTKSDVLLARMINRHALPVTPEALLKMLSADAKGAMLTITATASEAATADAVIAALQAELVPFLQELTLPNLKDAPAVAQLLTGATPAVDVSPSPLLFALYGLLVGFAAAYLFFLCLFLFSNRITNEEEVRATCPEIPYFGSIPTILPPADAAEAFYALRERLPRRSTERAVCLSVTSAIEGEGKSYVIAGLATSLAISGKQVLVIDADLRSNEKSDFYLPKKEPGFAEYLSGKHTTTDRMVRKTDCEGLNVLPAGLASVSPCDFPLSERVSGLLDAYAPHFDYILVDFPAVSTAAEAAATAKEFFGTLLVAAPHKCSVKTLREAGAAILQAGGSVVGLVVNTPPKDVENK